VGGPTPGRSLAAGRRGRRDRSARAVVFAAGFALAGALLLLRAFIAWLAVVAPVNREVAAALRSAPDSVPALWMRLRDRWEYGHAVGFVLQLLGFAALQLSVLLETPRLPPPR
jgi:hypothetical protein